MNISVEWRVPICKWIGFSRNHHIGPAADPMKFDSNRIKVKFKDRQLSGPDLMIRFDIFVI